MTGRRPVVLLTLLGAGLVLLAGTQTWATVKLTGAMPGLADLTVPGRRSAPAAIAIALAAAAGAVVLATSGRVVRFLVASGLVVAGAVVMGSGVRAVQDSSHSRTIAVRDSLRVLGSESGGLGDGSVSVSAWPWVAALGGLLILLAGLLTLIGGRSWPGPTRRYERSNSASGPVPGGAPASGEQAEAGPPPARGESPAAAWDALSRGEDPTSAS